MFSHVLDGENDQVVPFGEMSDAIPVVVRGHLDRIWRTAPFQHVIQEVRFVNNYQKQWAGAPYPVTFTTVDAVILCNGHVLMVERGEWPGKGQLALPGGFLAQDETLFESCVRELFEETRIHKSVPPAKIRNACVNRAATTFDDPFRSVRGRTVTHVYRFDLQESVLPKVKGADDARKALWVPIGTIRPEKCFEDHGHIIRMMLKTA
jgi:bifunctional NMN adenylyltransferase/nudix hydrolase